MRTCQIREMREVVPDGTTVHGRTGWLRGSAHGPAGCTLPFTDGPAARLSLRPGRLHAAVRGRTG